MLIRIEDFFRASRPMAVTALWVNKWLNCKAKKRRALQSLMTMKPWQQLHCTTNQDAYSKSGPTVVLHLTFFYPFSHNLKSYRLHI